MSSSNNVSGNHVEDPDLEELKRLHKACIWKLESHRNLFLEAFGRLTNNWIGEPPNLREIFAKEEIDWILVACVNSICLYRHVVEFVALCGYKNQPDLDEAGKPVLRRATAIHEIAKSQADGLNIEVLRDLFDIYDKFHVNYIDEVTGYTHLYVACRYGLYDVAEKFLEFVEDPDYLVPEGLVRGDTLLLLALRQPDKRIVQELLRRGADPNLANAKGQTALHLICQRCENGDLLQLLFEDCDEKEKTLRIDARDNEGNTPLHLATLCRSDGMVHSLLRRRADPSLANEEGMTPLHLMARNEWWLDELFYYVDEERLSVDIDARDNSGRTALEWAVASGCSLNVETLLLEREADVSGFVFPTPCDSDSYGYTYERPDESQSARNKLETAIHLLIIVELLEMRGYRRDRDAALKLMGFFDKYGLYDDMDYSTSEDVDDLFDTLFEEIALCDMYVDFYMELHNLRNWVPPQFMKDCCLRLCDEVLTKFLRDWTLDPFMELIHYRLPTECCEMIISTLRNKDLYNICLAAAGRSS